MITIRNFLPDYIEFLLFVLLVASLVWCLRYLYISYKAIRFHKKELQRLAQVADPETMDRYKWKGLD